MRRNVQYPVLEEWPWELKVLARFWHGDGALESMGSVIASMDGNKGLCPSGFFEELLADADPTQITAGAPTCPAVWHPPH